MPNRLFYTIKLPSSLLKTYKYNLTTKTVLGANGLTQVPLTFTDCLDAGWVISLSDSQMLKTIRDITGKQIDRDLLETWYQERDRLKKSKNNTQGKRNRIRELQSQIYNMMYIPEYITVLMEATSDYEHMFRKGFIFMGKKYVRASCSASQARVSTIVFVTEDIKEELKRRLDNGRDLSHPLAPSKYNAYFGLYSSASKKVTKPRFCIVPDYCENMDIQVSWSIENPDWDKDDTIEERTITNEFNRFDGSGLISPAMAEQWGQDIGEDFTPCQFCIRTSFTKGLVNEFDFIEWCRDELEGIKSEEEKYLITDIYGKTRDLREIDVILTEGMAKLWDSWDSQQTFEDNCFEHGIDWRVTKYSPKQDKEAGLLNYQYIQTLKDSVNIEELCKDTINYVQKVSLDDPYYSLLFCLGQGMNEEDIQHYMQSSDNYWIKSLIIDHNLLNDKYTKEKIRDMIVTRIEQACLGRLLVQGNYQAIVPDSYAFMQWITGQTVTGLLADGEFYSQFWEKHNVTRFACARSPQTYRSEWVIVDNKCADLNDKIHKYFKYDYSGIITNTHGQYTLNFAGSDFDFDIMFTTNCQEIINNTYTEELVTAYDVPKPKKKPNLTDEDLFTSDCFSFGQQIGPLTNISTTMYALLPKFAPGTPEYIKLIERLKQCCVNQSKQIDKTKIGRDVKCIPKIWNTWQKHKEGETPEEYAEVEFNNNIIAENKPYFFKYKYKALAKELNKYNKNYSEQTGRLFEDKTLDELLSMDSAQLTQPEKDFIITYKKHLPVVDTPCLMNNVCHYIEDIDFHIKQKVRTSSDFDYKTLLSQNFTINKADYELIKEVIEQTFKEWDETSKAKKKTKIEQSFNTTVENNKFDRAAECNLLRQKLLEINSNEEQLTNHLVYLFYIDKPSYSKSTLWILVGKQIFENIKAKHQSYNFPIKNPNGSLEFLYEKYQCVNLPILTLEEPEDNPMVQNETEMEENQ